MISSQYAHACMWSECLINESLCIGNTYIYRLYEYIKKRVEYNIYIIVSNTRYYNT